MARTSGRSPQEGEVPKTFAEIPPPAYSRVTGEAWIAELLMQMQGTIGELKANVSNIRSSMDNDEQAFRSDFRWTWGGIAAAVVLLMGALIFGYFKLDDKQAALSTGLTRIETKVDNLTQHLPSPSPSPQPAPSPPTPVPPGK